MGVCFGTPDFATPSHTGHLKSGAKWEVTPSSSSAASTNLPAARATSSSSEASKCSAASKGSAASNSHDLLAARDKKALGDGMIVADPGLTIFSFAELNEATKNFPADALLGEGRFGRVYKGMLHGKQQSGNTETIIAVKILNQGGTQGYGAWQVAWQRKLHYIGRISHPNLTKLLGFCHDDENLALVYEFMPMGSLENQLFRKVSADHLSWDVRLKIAVGAARGLAFLHNSCNMIHRDFKSANIMLDESYMAKLSDFGLVRSGPPEDNSHVSTQFIGTYGYAAPEYRTTGHPTIKSDVYSFGIVLLEILTGSRAFDLSSPADRVDLVERTRLYLSSKRKPLALVDTRLRDEYSVGSVRRIAQLAIICIRPNPKSRPSMCEVVETLESIAAVSAKGILRNV